MSFSEEKLAEAISHHRKKHPDTFSYGTSGIRDKGSKLESTVFRLGIVAALRSQFMKGQAIGMVITASHNHSDDNGVKLVDPHGGMFIEEWEPICTDLANIHDDQVVTMVEGLIEQFGNPQAKSLVFVGMDTRDSSNHLSKCAIDGARILDAEVRSFGLVTTPQLHYAVRTFNLRDGDPTLEGYCNKISTAFKNIASTFKNVPSKYVPILNIDCAHGVGAVAMRQLAPLLEPFLKIELHNTEGTGPVNFECGSYYVESELKQPSGIPIKADEHWASFDGDADRIIFYYTDREAKLHILNGDKIAALFCQYISELLTRCGLERKLSFKKIQTIYTNDKATQFVTDLGWGVEFTATGVKHLVRKAKGYDLAVWFESNGHGSVYFSDRAYSVVKERVETDDSGAAKLLLSIFDLINQATGDAISAGLLVEVILRARDWDLSDWDGLFTMNPSRLTKMRVKDRNLIKVNDIATEILEPSGLGDSIKMKANEFGEGSRVVVRPSGTEDVVRIYAESSSQEKADQLAEQVTEMVTSYMKD